MKDLTPHLVTILPRYVRDANQTIELTSRLKELGIEEPDYPMIVLDIEDACNVDIRYDGAFADCATVADLAILLVAKIPARPANNAPRAKSNWLSTSAARGR
jgi:hypothetical protein